MAQEADSVAVVGNTFFRVVFPLYLPGLKLSNLCVCVDRNFLLGATESRSPSRGTRERGRRIETGAAEQAQRGAKARADLPNGGGCASVRSKKFPQLLPPAARARSLSASPAAGAPLPVARSATTSSPLRASASAPRCAFVSLASHERPRAVVT